MPSTMMKLNGRNHMISFLKGLTTTIQSVSLQMVKNVTLMPLVLGQEVEEFVLGRPLPKAQ
jgi:hypothetical protein